MMITKIFFGKIMIFHRLPNCVVVAAVVAGRSRLRVRSVASRERRADV